MILACALLARIAHATHATFGRASALALCRRIAVNDAGRTPSPAFSRQLVSVRLALEHPSSFVVVADVVRPDEDTSPGIDTGSYGLCEHDVFCLQQKRALGRQLHCITACLWHTAAQEYRFEAEYKRIAFARLRDFYDRNFPELILSAGASMSASDAQAFRDG